MLDPRMPYSRRLFIKHGVALASMASTIPAFIQRSAFSMLVPGTAGQTSIPGAAQDRVLVIIQLGGGNDGLNTVVPYGMPEYFAARPALAVAEPGGRARGNAGVAIELDRSMGLGLNPNLTALKELYDEGLLGVIQGVGYPNPNRSHFASMDIWQTARIDGKGDGWIGRYFDNACNGTPIPEGAVNIGRTAPLALMGSIQKPISFESADLFRWTGDRVDPSLSDHYDRINRAGPIGECAPGSQRDFLMRTALDAQVASQRIRDAVGKKALARYPQSDIARQLQIVAALIRDGLGTRVFYVSKGGFDTHANQPGTHGNILRQVAEAMKAFNEDLVAQGNEGRVLTMVFSEFGRRVKQNASQGTDHGTAAPMFLMGPMVRPGVIGHHPSLTDLDQGDLKYGIDFRSVYASILGDWMRADPAKVLGGAIGRTAILRG